MARNISELRFFRLVIGGVLLAVSLNPTGLYGSKSPCSRAKEVKDAIKRITDSGIFPDDCKFLRRIAFVESKDGAALRDESIGGIWQLNSEGFDSTTATVHHGNLQGKLDKIQTEFGIDWFEVKLEDLKDSPFLSALAARLYLSNIEPPIPKSIEDQAEYWKQHYNTEAGAGTVQKFIDDITYLKTKFR